MRRRRCKSRPSTLCRHTGRYRQQQDSHESDRQTQFHDLRRRSLIIRRFTTRRGCRYFTTISATGSLLLCPLGTYHRSLRCLWLKPLGVIGARARGPAPENRAWLFPTPRMCYKRASEGLLEMGQPEAVVPTAQEAESQGSTARGPTGALSVLPAMFGSFAAAQLQDDLRVLRILHVLLGFLLKRKIAAPGL